MLHFTLLLLLTIKCRDENHCFTAEDRLRDKMAHAAREKLAQTSREKQMQAERKRKAAMFINMLRSCNPGAAGDEEKLEEEFLSKSSLWIFLETLRLIEIILFNRSLKIYAVYVCEFF